jgi:cobalt/nickel transport system permease protein
MKFLETTLRHLVKTSDYAATADRIAAGRGWLQKIDPRVKIAGLVALLIVAAAAHQLTPIALVWLFACVLALGSRIPLYKLVRWVWLPVLLFTGVIALPAAFMSPGLRGAAFPVLRAEAAATLSALLVLTTPWPRILRALRWFRVPAVVVVILGMTCRYIFVILETALEMLESRKSRTVGTLPPTEKRRLASASVGVLLSKSVALSNEVHLAMLSRGFRGDIRLLEDAAAK